MFRKIGVTLSPFAILSIAEAAEQYDTDKKKLYAKENLLKSRSDFKSKPRIKDSKTTAPTLLGTGPPKFPYLLSVSAGDNPAIVINTLLTGIKLVGPYEEPARDTIKRITAPASALGLAACWVATQYSNLKKKMYRHISKGLNLHVNGKVSAEDVMMEAILLALRDLQMDNIKESTKNAYDPINSPTSEVNSRLVFLLRDFDLFSDEEAERWLRWTHLVLHENLVHVILHITSTVTPSKMQWIQERHRLGLSGDASGKWNDFIGILVRPAHGLVDCSSANEKLHDLAKVHGLNLFRANNKNTLDPANCSDKTGDHATGNSLAQAIELECITRTTGNWWSDIDKICRQLTKRNFNIVTNQEKRLNIIEDVCGNLVEKTKVKVLRTLQLDESLQLLREELTSDPLKLSSNCASHEMPTTKSFAKALSALETWKCLKTLTHLPLISSGSSVDSRQHFVDNNIMTPIDCVSPVDALLPFNHRKDGEKKFFDLIDHHILFLRPKDAVDIGVIPTEDSKLVSTCWIQVRPVVKSVFQTIHESDLYYQQVLELDRFVATVELRRNIELYALEIADRRKTLSTMKRDFKMSQTLMNQAEKAQQEAELALIDVELQSKDVHLEKLRVLLNL